MICSWLFHDLFMICFMILSWFFYVLSMICMISCRFFDDFFTGCLMILRCFRCVFFNKCASGCSGKHIFVLGHSDSSLFVPWLFQSSRRSGWERAPSELGGNVSCQSWVETRPARSCAFVFPLFSEMSSFGICASGCSRKHVFPSLFNEIWRNSTDLFNDLFMIASWFVQHCLIIFSGLFLDVFLFVSWFLHDFFYDCLCKCSCSGWSWP